MGVYSFLVLGLAPIGSLQAGLVSEHLGVRYSIGLGGAACCLTVAWVAWYLGKSRPGGQADRWTGRPHVVDELRPIPESLPVHPPVRPSA